MTLSLGKKILEVVSAKQAKTICLKIYHDVKKQVYKSDFNRYSPSSMATLNKHNSNLNIIVEYEVSQFFKNSCLVVYYQITKEVLIVLVTFMLKAMQRHNVTTEHEPVALFSEAAVKTAVGKPFEIVEKTAYTLVVIE